jgi:hypothetical protein
MVVLPVFGWSLTLALHFTLPVTLLQSDGIVLFNPRAMKKPDLNADKIRYTSNLRHYHRSGAQSKRSWDEWVDGPGASVRKPSNILKITLISLGVLALIAIIGGLMNELR